MAELNIGKHCDLMGCNALDFLPFVCNACSKTFCLTHKVPDDHNCSKCNVEDNTKTYTGEKSYCCSLSGCQGRELMPVICDACALNFCLQHRLYDDHKCTVYKPLEAPVSQAAQHVKKMIANKPARVPKNRGRKSQVTAAKVNLMRIKQTAAGDKSVPDVERVYLRIVLPHGDPTSTTAADLAPKNKKSAHTNMFFSKRLPVGRIIDLIAQHSKLVNKNNVSDAKKLRLFHHHNGLWLDPSVPLSTYVTTPATSAVPRAVSDDSGSGSQQDSVCVYSGDTLILEYVSDDIRLLEDLSAYTT